MKANLQTSAKTDELKGDARANCKLVQKMSLPIIELINEDEFYLIKTSFGLIGWVKIPECIISDTPIKGLYYAGD